METGASGKSMARHRQGGHVTNQQHFTGKQGGKRQSRVGKGLTRKQRRKKRGSHVNKYGGDKEES